MAGILEAVVRFYVPAIGDTYSESKMRGIVVGINHPRKCSWVRVVEVLKSGTNYHIGQVVRRNWEIIRD